MKTTTTETPAYIMADLSWIEDHINVLCVAMFDDELTIVEESLSRLGVFLKLLPQDVHGCIISSREFDRALKASPFGENCNGEAR